MPIELIEFGVGDELADCVGKICELESTVQEVK